MKVHSADIWMKKLLNSNFHMSITVYLSPFLSDGKRLKKKQNKQTM